MTESTNEKLDRVARTVAELDDVVLGSWDLTKTERRPGMVERLTALETKLDGVAAELRSAVQLLRWGVGPLVTVCALAASQTALKDIIPLLAKVLPSLMNLP